MKVSILIVNYNTSNYIIKCVESIIKYENIENIEIIIADNNSIDDSPKIINLLTHKYKFVKALFLESNKGFAYGNNRAFEISTGEYVLILNPDICFREPLLENLKSILKNDIIAVAPKLYGEDGKYQFEYYQKFPTIRQYLYFYSIFAKLFRNRKGLKDKFLYDLNTLSDVNLTEVSQLPGAFIFLKRDTFKKVNLFNEKYFLFFEDVELSFKLSKLGKIVLVNELGVTHIGASSMEQRTNDILYGLFIISMLKFFKYNYSYLGYITLFSFCFINTLAKLTLNFLISPFKKKLRKTSIAHKYILKNILKL